MPDKSFNNAVIGKHFIPNAHDDTVKSAYVENLLKMPLRRFQQTHRTS